MSEQTQPKGRRPYTPPAIKFEKKIEAFATACTCDINKKSVAGATSFGATSPTTTCISDGFS